MVRAMKRITTLFLVFVLFSTLSLYAASNAVFLRSTIGELFFSVSSMSVQPTRNLADAGNAQMGAKDEPMKKPDEINLPIFAFDHLVKDLDESIEQAVILLGTGSEGNLWLIEKMGTQWYVAAGPLYCRIGREGLTNEKTDGDNKTPIGFTNMGLAFGASIEGNFNWPSVQLTSGDGWVMDPQSPYYNQHMAALTGGEQNVPCKLMPVDGKAIQYIDVGYNSQRVPGLGAGVFIQTVGWPTVATDGGISVSDQTMERIGQFLVQGKRPVMGMFLAEESGWEITKEMPASFVYLTDVAPSIREDARYAGNNNFMGRPLQGYLGKRVIVSQEMAQALLEVQNSLQERGLGLLVYDGYRPKRAVEDIFNWMKDAEDTAMQPAYYPNLEKKSLAGIYLAEYSPHTRGAAVDLTLCDATTGKPLDMGTEFDFFSSLSWYSSDGVTPQQQHCRRILREAMMKAGFEPYEKEWWHFNLYRAQNSDIAYDFIIAQ